MNILRLSPAVILGLSFLAGGCSHLNAKSADTSHADQQHVSAEHHQQQSIFRKTSLGDEFYLLQGEGGNILVSRGQDGIAIVDSDYQKNAGALNQVLQHWPEDVAYLINTHWHFDHAGGNQQLGAGGAAIIAHESVRELLSQEQKITFFDKVIPATEESGLPILTFNDSMNLYVNHKKFELMHLPAGHTSGDVVINLREQDMIHMGDLFFNGIFPFVDVEHGGRVKGIIQNIDTVLANIGPSTRVIPGHGPLGNRQDLLKFQVMLKGTHAEVSAMMKQGMKLKEIQKQGLSEQWLSWGAGFLNEEAWIAILYASIQVEL